MGYTQCIMDAKRGNASPVPVHNLSGPPRGQMVLKSSPFCHRSSSRLTQYIIQDHMVSHYKKVYSAKAAVDASAPKSLLHSVKYNDQLRREQLRKEASRSERRPQSARSHSQRSSRANTRASCSPVNTQSRASALADESAYFCLGSSMISSPRLNTSFHAKQIVYPSRTAAGSGSPSHPLCSTSEFSYRSPDYRRQHSARSCVTSGGATQSSYKAFQDPIQKTYSGDLLQKHAHHFTQDKPFTPRTLKSDGKSYLSQYRYYTPPRRKPTQERTSPRLTLQETYHRSTRTKECSSAESEDPPQGFGNEWSDDESHTLNHSSFGRHSKGNKARDSDLLHSSYRVSPEGMKSPIMRRVSAEEDELMYLEFIADVTDEILSRGLYSDRILEWVFERHIDKNIHRLDMDKMRHLLEVLRYDLQSPASTPICTAKPEKSDEETSDLLHRHLQSLDPGMPSETKEDNDLFAYASFNKGREELENIVPLSVSTPLYGSPPERIASPVEGGTEDLEGHNHIRGNGSPPGENTNLTITNEEDQEELNQQLVDNHDGLSREVEDLERNLESLFVSDTPDSPLGITEHINNTVVSLSDDEF